MEEKLMMLAEWGVNIEETMERFLDDKELYVSMLGRFAEDEEFTQLGNAISTKEYNQAFEYAHSLKGVSANLGLTPLYVAICEIVEPLRNEEYDNLNLLYQAVMDRFGEAKKIIMQ